MVSGHMVSEHVSELLIIEDDPLDVAIISEFLKDRGDRLTFADDGLSGWQMLDAAPQRFDLVIMDRLMPRLDGLDLLAKITGDPRFAALPVIMQTSANAPEQVAEGLAAGAWYYLGKPYKAESLQRIVSGALDDRSNRLEVARLQAEMDDIWGLFRDGRFRFRTPAQAQLLSARLGTLCPHAPQVPLGLSELMLNAVEHGNLGITYAEKGRLLESGQLNAEIERRLAAPEQQGRWAEVQVSRDGALIRFRIQDQGPGFDWHDFLDISKDRIFDSHGRGIAMARHLAFADLFYEGRGNVVTALVDSAAGSGPPQSPAAGA
jgi:CheY-like chemotaxis protein/anti-sigma regulatory factor (Ser/Thr protein kinase)